MKQLLQEPVIVNQPTKNQFLRNVAIIAHVDHGKTTLVDFMLRQGGIFRENQSFDERVMDSMELERERGITIASKNCAIHWRGVKINVIDTPGHADFGGEVERGLSMVDGAILLVDASEGPLPQTRFVLRKALENQLVIIVVVNKIDRKDAHPEFVLDQIYDLFIDLGASEEQLDFPLLYAIGREGIAQNTLSEKGRDLSPLFDMILEKIPAPLGNPQETFQMLVSNLSYSDYLGRLAIGKIFHGAVRSNESLVCIDKDVQARPLKLTRLQIYEGLKFKEVDYAEAGDIVIISGIENVAIGDTICTRETPKALKRIVVDEPTISMEFMVSDCPFTGQEGEYVQSRKIFERLQKETLHNVALRVEMGENNDHFVVKGRGEFQMAILVETMRREGYELCVGRPQIIFKHQNGKKMEPIEHLYIDCDEEFLGVVTEKLAQRKGRMTNLVNHGSGRIRLEFSIPSRGLIGYRMEFLTDTRGTGLMSSYLLGYEEYRGDLVGRVTGSLVSDRLGETVAYGLFHLQSRGVLFVGPGVRVYEGMVVGENSRERDMNINVCRCKKLTNVRTAGKDENVVLTPPRQMNLERALEFIRDDELVEATPQNIRLRKKTLPACLRK